MSRQQHALLCVWLTDISNSDLVTRPKTLSFIMNEVMAKPPRAGGKRKSTDSQSERDVRRRACRWSVRCEASGCCTDRR